MFNHIKKIFLITSIISTMLYSDNILAPEKPGIYNIKKHSARISFMDNSNNEEGFKIYNNGTELLITKPTSLKEGMGYQYQDITDLDSCTIYQLTIVAYNTVFQSHKSKTGSFRTLCDSQLNPPNSIGVYNIKETTARISFYDYSTNEDGFYIYNHGKLFKTIPTINKLGKGWQYINLSDLNASTYYNLTIESFDNIGNKSGIPIGQSNGKFRTKSTLSRVQIRGNLINANVNIYKIEDNGTKQLVYSELTDDRGVFDAHRTELEDDKLYIYQATGGVDTQNSVDNNGTLRAIAKGGWLKNLNQGFVISLVSEMSYIFMNKDLKYHFDAPKIAKTLDEIANAIFVKDITGDYKITANDLLVFEYQKDLIAINNRRYSPTEIDKIISDLYKNQIYRNSIFTPIISRNTINIWNGLYEEEGVLTDELIGSYLSSSFIKKAVLEKRFVVNSTEVLSTDKKRLFKLERNYLVVYNIEKNNNPIEMTRYRLASLYGKGIGITLSEDEKEAFIVVDDTCSDCMCLCGPVLSLIVLDINVREIIFPNKEDYSLDYSDIGYYILPKTVNNIKISISQNPSSHLVFNDISNPDVPIEISTYSSDYDFIGEFILSLDKTKLIVVAGNHIEIVDISDIYNPILLDYYDTGNSIMKIILSSDGKYIFIANHGYGFKIVDIRNPYNLVGRDIRLLPNIYYPDEHIIMNMYISKDKKRLFLRDTDSTSFTRLIEIDVSNPNHPVEVARYY